MKKISAAFDGLKFSKGTLEYAVHIAAESKALLSGIFLDSFLHHSFHIHDMIGSQGVSAVKLKHLLTKDEETRLKSTAAFKKACTKAGIKYTIHRDESFAIRELLKESIYSDLLLINARETFSHFTEEPPGHFITDLLEDMQCPVMIVPAEYKPIEKVVLLYDGKPSSVFAIKMFNYLMPWLKGIEAEVVSVTDPRDDGDLPESELIKEFIQCHYPEAVYTLLKGAPEVEIINHVRKIPGNVLTVLGAYRRGSVSRWFKKSIADILMEEINSPLFIAHNK